MADKEGAAQPGQGGPEPYDVAQHVADQPDPIKGVAPDFAGGDTPTPTSGADTSLADRTKRPSTET